MAKLSKAEKEAKRLRAREERRQAQGEVTASKLRTVIGFTGAYVGTQVLLPMMAPTIAENQSIVDGVLGIGGGAVALLNDGPIGDYALGVGLVGGIQTLDNIGAKIQEWRASNP